GRPRTAEREPPPAVRPGRPAPHRLARRRRHRDPSAEQGLPHADRDVAVHTVALPVEERMLPDSGADDQIPTRPTERAGIAFVGDPDLRTGIDPGRHRDADRLYHPPHATAHAGATPTLPPASAGPPRRASREPRDVAPDICPPHDLGKRQIHYGVHVVTAAPGRQRLVGTDSVTVPVVHLARPRVAEHPECLRDLLEELAGALVPEIDVGRILPREALVCPAHLARRSCRRDTKHCVVVATHELLLLLVAQILEVSVDHFAFLRARRALTLRARSTRAGRLPLRLAVHDLRELVRCV